MYSGLVELEKTGLKLSSRGFVPPTIGNITLVLDRLRTLGFPYGAVTLYVMALLVRSALVVGTIFSLSSPFQMLGPELKEPSPEKRQTCGVAHQSELWRLTRSPMARLAEIRDRAIQISRTFQLVRK